MQLTRQQHDAIFSDSRRLLLEAGAGSGKTMVLVNRYCRLAESEEGGVGSIVAITFTERAAAEMRDRVRKRLAELHKEASEGDDTERAERLAQLERRSGSAWIGTIHSFCQRLIGQYSTRCDLDPRFTVLDEDASKRLREQAFNVAAAEFLADPEKVPAPVAAMRLATLHEIVDNTYGRLTSQGLDPRLPEIEKPGDEEILERIGDVLRLADAAADEMEAALAANPGWSDNSDQLGKLRAAAAADPEEVRRTRAQVLGSKLDRRPKCAKGECCSLYNDALPALRRFLIEAELGVDSWQAIGELVTLFHGRYTALKESRSALDFNDLERKALELVTNDGYVRARLHDRIRHLMVDEFQDTNRLQMRLIEAVCGPDTSLFCVGDELQSIYRFRNADVEVFRETRQRFARLGPPDGQVLKLQGNFRSHPDVIASVNEFGRSLFPEYQPLTRGRSPEEVKPAAPGLDGPRVEVIAVAAKSADGDREWDESNVVPDSDPAHTLSTLAEIRLLARRLREMVDAGVRRGDIVVLVRAGTHARRVRDELAAAGLDPYLVAGRGYFDNQQVEDMRRILAVVANPLDDESLIAMAVSPAAMFTPDDLLTVATARKRRDEPLWEAAGRLVADGQASVRVADLVEKIDRLRDRAAELPVDRLIEEAAETFGFDLAVLAMDDGEARWANVRKLMDLAIGFEETEGRDLRGFVDHVEASATNASKEAEAVIEAEGSDRVRIMTIHASKGLEFPVVAVPFTGRSLSGPGDGNILLGKPGEHGSAPSVGISLPIAGSGTEKLFAFEELKAEDAEAGSLEERRLAHVAFTRARQHLIISGRFSHSTVDDQPQAPGVPVIHRMLADRNREAGSITAPAADAAIESLGDVEATIIPLKVVEPGDEVLGPVRGEPGSSPVEPAAGTGGMTARPFGAPQPAALRKLSYASIATYKQCPRCFQREYVIGIRGGEAAPVTEVPMPEPTGGRENDEVGVTGPAPVTPAERARRYGPGNALHRLLETSAAAGWQPVTDEQIAAVLATEGLTDEATRERLRQMIDAWFRSDLFTEISPLRCRPEVPFLMAAGPETPDSIVRGVIDLLVELPDGGRMVVDYKTDRVENEADVRRLMEGKYGLQRQIYSIAASRPDRPATTAYVFLGGPGNEPPPVVRATADPAYLDTARETIAGIAVEMLDGRFDPDPGCPVCAGNRPR